MEDVMNLLLFYILPVHKVPELHINNTEIFNTTEDFITYIFLFAIAVL